MDRCRMSSVVGGGEVTRFDCLCCDSGGSLWSRIGLRGLRGTVVESASCSVLVRSEAAPGWTWEAGGRA